MASWISDLKNAARIGASFSHAARTALATGSGVDLQGCNNQAFGIIVGLSLADGVHTISVQESRNNNVADPEPADPYTNVEATIGSVAAALPVVVTAGTVVFNFTKNKRWVRAIATPTGSITTGAAYSVLLGSQKSRF